MPNLATARLFVVFVAIVAAAPVILLVGARAVTNGVEVSVQYNRDTVGRATAQALVVNNTGERFTVKSTDIKIYIRYVTGQSKRFWPLTDTECIQVFPTHPIRFGISDTNGNVIEQPVYFKNGNPQATPVPSEVSLESGVRELVGSPLYVEPFCDPRDREVAIDIFAELKYSLSDGEQREATSSVIHVVGP